MSTPADGAPAHHARILRLPPTALAMRGDEARCLAAGATAHLAKPVRLKELSETVARLVGGARP
jgi:CheY-like chemotaxis protein